MSLIETPQLQAQDETERERAAIAAAYRTPEPDCVPPLIEEARLDAETAGEAACLAYGLVERLRSDRSHAFGVEALMKQFSLSSREGVALMCLAESLLRIPDSQTRDLLIRDKLSRGDWGAHVGASPSWFVNASAWGLLVTGKLVATSSERGMAAALTRAVARGGEPIVRQAMDLAMRLLGRQFVTGQTIEEALEYARPFEERGFLYSYDMLGEAAVTEEDAAGYMASYEHSIEAVGARASASVYEGAGISVKLSALHPRYSYAQMDRVRGELYPRLLRLAQMAAQRGIGFNIDAEEADRLEPSLDLIEALAHEPALAGWQGLGFVVQAYQKRAPFVIDYLIGLAERTRRRLMIRLVKGAYWDSEIKRAQVDGLSGYPVFTRKSYTDVCYLACVKRLLARRDVVFPQFATHNAHTLAAIYHMAGREFRRGDFEFQCLHGMGENLYGLVVGPENLNRPCRIYAPVGTHKTLLAYLVRRLLENGANSSFVHQLVDDNVRIEDLVADPVAEAASSGGSPHPAIALPQDLFGAGRRNSKGRDLSDRKARSGLEAALIESAVTAYDAPPILAAPVKEEEPQKAILNPANHSDIVGDATAASMADVERAMAVAAAAASDWAAVGAAKRSEVLERGADLFEGAMDRLAALLIREAGKTMANAVSEVREAVDYCRYYAAETRRVLSAPHTPLGPTVCISPWNFPLAIFTGQVAAALAAGNPALAKPAEQTPLIAAEAVQLLHEAGVPRDALQLVPGPGSVVGSALVADPRTQAVVFTGSTEVARSIQRTLASRGNIPLIAETGGQNAMIVDSSALPEQVVGDVLASAFDSAGQRCSALRVLCVQEEIADRLLAMLKGAMAELRIGDPARIETDVGPVIDARAREALEAYLANPGHRILYRTPLPACAALGTFVAPALVEIGSIRELTHEVFGPVLHVVRFTRADLPRLIDDINATGYGLTLGVHSRIDETIDFVVSRARAGNIYVNRNMIGAVVGVQPFGGEGLSGTGPKAGGPLYLQRLVRAGPSVRVDGVRDEARLETLAAFAAWLEGGAGRALSDEDCARLAENIRRYGEDSLLPVEAALPGPVGEDNRLRFLPRGAVLGIADTAFEALRQAAAALATGNRFLLAEGAASKELREWLPDILRSRIELNADLQAADFDAVLVSGEEAAQEVARSVAERPGPIIPVLAGKPDYGLHMLVKEKTVSINTTAAGGNASLLTLVK
jgi:RHH-type transcriptional regulator, proline utilization regulon repressor / proline dehydrogenase / delta 1-pyrroline-5-carboxylate dehydrogenase